MTDYMLHLVLMNKPPPWLLEVFQATSTLIKKDAPINTATSLATSSALLPAGTARVGALIAADIGFQQVGQAATTTITTANSPNGAELVITNFLESTPAYIPDVAPNNPDVNDGNYKIQASRVGEGGAFEHHNLAIGPLALGRARILIPA